jgi:UDP-N-acetylglucosamine 2-epimerase (non-hydrolysing)
VDNPPQTDLQLNLKGSIMRVFLVAGARPNFMKIAPIYRASREFRGVECRIVHTGQHYDYAMSQAFFDDLELPRPEYFLDAGSGTHAEQTAKIMVAFEKACSDHKPDLVIVVGDVNSTLACSVVAKKLMIQVAHVEAGLRSFDLSMPEEINRMVTDAISDLFFVTEESGRDNLLREGKPTDRIHLVGNVMIDNLLHQVRELESTPAQTFPTAELKQRLGDYAFLTLHRPSNVDDRGKFKEIAEALNTIAEELPIVFPIHPRTRKMQEAFAVSFSTNIHLMPPLGFRESLFLWKDARMVLTDSGGLQEETTALKKPCITIRDNTERPITVTKGSNTLAGTSRGGILGAFRATLVDSDANYDIPPLWDGRAAERIWEILFDTPHFAPPGETS